MKEAVVRRSVEEGVSINDVIISSLADHFDVAYEPTGRAGSGSRSTGAGVVQLRRIPPELRARLKAEVDLLPPGTKKNPVSTKQIVNRVLREQLGLPAVVPAD